MYRDLWPPLLKRSILFDYMLFFVRTVFSWIVLDSVLRHGSPPVEGHGARSCFGIILFLFCLQDLIETGFVCPGKNSRDEYEYRILYRNTSTTPTHYLLNWQILHSEYLVSLWYFKLWPCLSGIFISNTSRFGKVCYWSNLCTTHTRQTVNQIYSWMGENIFQHCKAVAVLYSSNNNNN